MGGNRKLIFSLKPCFPDLQANAGKSLTKPGAAPKLTDYRVSQEGSDMKRSQISLVAVVLWLTIGVKPGLAAPDEYDDSQSNPFRVAAYLLHPIGWLTEWIVFRPFHFLVSATRPQEAFFGHQPHPPVLASHSRSKTTVCRKKSRRRKRHRSLRRPCCYRRRKR